MGISSNANERMICSFTRYHSCVSVKIAALKHLKLMLYEAIAISEINVWLLQLTTFSVEKSSSPFVMVALVARTYARATGKKKRPLTITERNEINYPMDERIARHSPSWKMHRVPNWASRTSFEQPSAFDVLIALRHAAAIGRRYIMLEGRCTFPRAQHVAVAILLRCSRVTGASRGSSRFFVWLARAAVTPGESSFVSLSPSAVACMSPLAARRRRDPISRESATRERVSGASSRATRISSLARVNLFSVVALLFVTRADARARSWDIPI